MHNYPPRTGPAPLHPSATPGHTLTQLLLITCLHRQQYGNLIGTIEHWGHIHERENKYDANFKIQLKDDAWKITEMQVNNEEQGVVKTSLRKF